MTRARSILAMAATAMIGAAGPISAATDLNLWANGDVRDAPARSSKSRSSHKQNARRAKKGRK